MVFDWAEVTSRARIAANRVNPRRVSRHCAASRVFTFIERPPPDPRLYVGSSSTSDGGGWMDGWTVDRGMDGREPLLIATNCV